MKHRMHKMTAALAAAVMLLTGTATVTAAEDTTKIVVLGDGISSGAGLAEGEKNYVELVQAYIGTAEVQNFAVENNTMPALLEQLEDAQVQAALSEADMILVTIGMHDAVDPFMETAHGFMDEFGFAKFSDVFTALLEDYGLTEDMLQDEYAPQLIEAAKRNRETAAADMLLVGEALSVYGDKVVYQNVYNPIDTIENLSELSTKRRLAYNMICNPVSAALKGSDSETSVNRSLQQISEQYGCGVVDVFTGFDNYAYRYVNLDELDVHPTAEGHQWIAVEVLAAAGALKKGDTNGDGVVNTVDAGDVLVHAAYVGSGADPTLSAGKQTAADVDGSGKCDSADASAILVYAAEAGSGKVPSWD